MRWNVLSVALAAALAWGAVPASADVDTEVPLPAKLQGTLGPGEVETVRFFAPGGSLLQVKLATKKGSGVDPGLRVLDPDGLEVPLPAGNVTDKGDSIKVKNLALDRSGTWAVEVSGVGAGDYKLAVKARVPTKRVEDVTLGGGAVAMQLAVQYGATVKITAKAAKGSPATPVVQSLDGIDLTAAGKRKAGLHKVSVTAPASGDLVLLVDGEGDPGDARVTVSIKPPAAKAAKIDVRGAALGRPAGGETAVGRVILPDQGGRVEAGPASDLFGASVDVPPGALSEPVLVTIRSADAERLADPDADTNAGPTVEFQPSGLQFSQPVVVTVPIDPQALPVQASEGDITVLIVEDDGSTREVVPTSVDLDAGVCTVQVSGFSRFTSVAPAGSPQLAGRSYWGFTFDMRLEDDLSGRDESGLRRVSRADALLDFDVDGFTVTATGEERELLFGTVRNQSEQLEGLLQSSTASFQDTGYWQYGTDGRRVGLQFSDDPEDPVFVSRDGTVLVNATAEPDEGTPSDAILDVFVERPATTDPTSLVVGTYYIGELSYFVEQPAPGSLLTLELLRGFGTLKINANGSATVDIVEVDGFGVPRFGGSGTAFQYAEERFRGGLSWSIDPSGQFAGSVLIDTGDELVLRMLPHRDGTMFVAMPVGDDMLDVPYIVGVKQSSGRSLADLDGEHSVGTVFVRPNQYQIEDGPQGSGQFVTIPDFDLDSTSERITFDGSSSALLSSRGVLRQFRDPLTMGGVARDTTVFPDETLQVSLRGDGRFQVNVEGAEIRGAITRDGTFGFLVPDPDQREFGLILIGNRPPDQDPPP